MNKYLMYTLFVGSCLGSSLHGMETSKDLPVAQCDDELSNLAQVAGLLKELEVNGELFVDSMERKELLINAIYDGKYQDYVAMMASLYLVDISGKIDEKRASWKKVSQSFPDDLPAEVFYIVMGKSISGMQILCDDLLIGDEMHAEARGKLREYFNDHKMNLVELLATLDDTTIMVQNTINVSLFKCYNTWLREQLEVIYKKLNLSGLGFPPNIL